jgi:hypothetical protein
MLFRNVDGTSIELHDVTSQNIVLLIVHICENSKSKFCLFRYVFRCQYLDCVASNCGIIGQLESLRRETYVAS